MKDQVIVVGAGPAGAVTAIELATRGVSVLLLDRDRFPKESPYGAGLTGSAVELCHRLGIGHELEEQGQPITELKIVTPGGRSMVIGPRAPTTILLRPGFDALLTRRAQSLGARFRDGVRVTSLLRERGRVTGVRTADGDGIRAPYVVCADGSGSIFSAGRRPKSNIGTLMGMWENADIAPGRLELVFDPRLAPFYGWLLPEADGRVNIGVCVDRPRRLGGQPTRRVHDAFDRFVATHCAGYLRSARPVGKLKGRAVTSPPWEDRLAIRGALYVGDAARVTSHATGDGITEAMRSGVLAANALCEVLSGRTTEAHAFRRYVWRNRSHLGFEGILATAVRAAVRSGLLDCVAAAYGRPKIRRAVARIRAFSEVGTSPSSALSVS